MPDPEVMEQFKTIPASNTCDVMGRNAAMNPRIHLVSSPKAQMMVGPALTVKARGGDNLALHAALNIAEAGDVVVVSNEEDNTRSLIGEIMMAYLRHDRKVAGIVIDGPIRDIDEIGQWDFPVYATGTTPGGPYKEGPGEVNVPVACGGISVNPGDIILGDPDGVIVIPHLGASTAEAEDNCAIMAVQEISDYMENGNITHSVNYPDCQMGICQTAGRIALLHYNRQGVIAQYTTILGDANINVSDMTNKTRGDFAYALLDIDAPVTPEVVEKLDAIEDMIRVRVVK